MNFELLYQHVSPTVSALTWSNESMNLTSDHNTEESC